MFSFRYILLLCEFLYWSFPPFPVYFFECGRKYTRIAPPIIFGSNRFATSASILGYKNHQHLQYELFSSQPFFFTTYMYKCVHRPFKNSIHVEKQLAVPLWAHLDYSLLTILRVVQGIFSIRPWQMQLLQSSAVKCKINLSLYLLNHVI